MKGICAIAALSAALAAAGMEPLTLDLPAGGVPGSRAFVDVPIGAAMLKESCGDSPRRSNRILIAEAFLREISST